MFLHCWFSVFLYSARIKRILPSFLNYFGLFKINGGNRQRNGGKPDVNNMNTCEMAAQNMLRLCTQFRVILQPRSCGVLNNQTPCFFSKSVEEKLGYPTKPKKPISVFLRYLQRVRPSIRKSYPNASHLEVSKHAGTMWAACDPGMKKGLEEEYGAEMEKYYKQISVYESKLTDDQKSEIKEAKVVLKEIKEKKLQKRDLIKKAAEFGKPKKPTTAFLTFSVSEMKNRGDTPLTEYQKIVGQKWRNLPENVKTKYLSDAEKAKNNYAKELQAWEEKMQAAGHYDLVRVKSSPSSKTTKKKSNL